MIKLENIYYSRFLVIIFLIIGIANILSDWTVFNILSLNPSLILSHLEFWRMLSFTILPGSIEGALLFSFTFWFIGPKLESRFDIRKLGLLLSVVSFILGSLFSLIYINQNIYISGSEGLSLFIIILFIMTELSSNQEKYSFATPVSLPFILLVTVIWFASTVIHGSFTQSSTAMIPIISASIGIILSIFVFLQMRFANYISGKGKRTLTSVPIPSPEELIGSLTAKREAIIHNAYEDEIEEFSDIDDSNYFSEAKLNRILDKINGFGRDSLSSSEKLYLKEYSNNI